MDYHTDYIVRLVTETEYSSLYNWCLQEFDSDGEQVGGDLIPWAWSLHFAVTKIHYAFSLENDDPDCFRFDEEPKGSETDGSDMAVTSSEVILAELVPAHGGDYRTSYSMVGTNRQISIIQLRIAKADKDACDIWGSVSYTSEINFRNETSDDIIEVHLLLIPEKFDELARMINSGRIDEASLRLKGVSGFYSDWSPEISTNFIKVLTPYTNDHKVEAPENTDINPPRLGEVQEFQFELNNSHRLTSNSRDEIDSANFAWAKKQVEAEVRSVSEDTKNFDGDVEDDDAMSHTLNEERVETLRRSLKYKLLNQMFREASSYAASNDLVPDELGDLSHEIRSFFSELESAFQKDRWYDHKNDPEALTDFYKRTWQLWQHQQIRFDEIRKGEFPHVDRGSLAEAVAMYLDLPIRNRSIDRMLVDACVAAEVIAFADQMLNVQSYLGALSASPFVKSHPLWRFIKGQVLSFVMIVAIPIGLLVGAVKLFDLTGNWPFFAALGLASLWALFFLIGLIALPSLWISETRQKRKAGKLLEGMHTVYTEIGSGTVVSARHIRERLDKTTEQGAVWPSEVFPLLDDVIDRGGVM